MQASPILKAIDLNAKRPPGGQTGVAYSWLITDRKFPAINTHPAAGDNESSASARDKPGPCSELALPC